RVDGDVAEKWIDLVTAEPFDDDPRLAGGIDHRPRPRRALAAVGVDEPEGDPVGVEDDVEHTAALEHDGARARGVPEQDLIEPLAQDLEGLRARGLDRGGEVGVLLESAVLRAKAGAPL